MRSLDVVSCKLKWIAKRVIDVALSRKVQHGVYVFMFKHVIQEVHWANIAFNKFNVKQALKLLQVFQTGAVVKLIENDYLRVWSSKRDSQSMTYSDVSTASVLILRLLPCMTGTSLLLSVQRVMRWNQHRPWLRYAFESFWAVRNVEVLAVMSFLSFATRVRYWCPRAWLGVSTIRHEPKFTL